MESSDDLDSLFEGMILIDNTFPSSPPSPPAPAAAHDQEPTLAATAAAAADQPLQKQLTQPLDESLFSDLTFFNPSATPDDHNNNHQHQDDPAIIPSTATLPPPSIPARLPSRKKKRAANRIGYGRAVSDPEPSNSIPPSLSPSSPQPAPPSPSPAHIVTYSSPVDEDVAADSHPYSAAKNFTQTPEVQSTTEDGAECSHDSSRKDSLLEAEDEKPVESPVATVAHFDDAVEKSTQVNQEEEESAAAAAEADGTSSIDEAKLDSLRARIAEQLEQILEMAATVSDRRKGASRRRRKAVENVNSASAKYKDLERQLEEACEAEDFEQAESVSEGLATAEREKQGFLNALKEAEADCDSMDTKMQDVLALQIAAEEEGVMLLQQFAKDAVDNADLAPSHAKELSSKEMEEWLSSVEALEIKRMELDIKMHLIGDARSGLKDAIDLSVENDRNEKELLYKKQDILKHELDELLVLVRMKEAEISENTRNIEEVENRITNVVSGFHEAQSNIDAKYEKLQLSISQIELENKDLSTKKKKIDEFLSQTEIKESKLKELATVSAEEAKARQEFIDLRKNLASTFLNSRKNKVRLAKSEEDILEDVQNLRQQNSAARASLQELSSTRASIHQGIDSSKQRIIFIEKRGPELDAEKKAAAAARNFKEAGRTAAEAKALSTEKEGLQNKVEKDIFRLNELEEQMKETVNKLQENEALILCKEKEAAMARCERLQLVSAAAMAERSAALKLGDLKEASVLLAEAESAKLEASKLQETYDLEAVEIRERDFISLGLIVNLAGKDLAEMTASIQPSTV